jgi:hypothetical protein
MKTTAIAHSRRASLAWSAVSRVARLSVFGFIGWLFFLSRDASTWKAVPLLAVLGLAALVGITWFVSRAVAERRWRAALDRYAESEIRAELRERRSDL